MPQKTQKCQVSKLNSVPHCNSWAVLHAPYFITLSPLSNAARLHFSRGECCHSKGYYNFIHLAIWGVFSSVTGGGSENTGNLQIEVETLEELSRQLFLEAVDLQNTRARMHFSKTIQGRYFDFVGHIFSGYCVWKIFISTVNIIFDRVGKVDPVTRGLQITVKYIGLQMDVMFWSQQFSFLLIGILIVTSIRGLLITMTKFFNSMASAKSSNIIVLTLAEIMGMYFVSSVLLMRMNMPEKYRLIITQVLGDLQFNFYHRWFDLIFLISALSSIGFLYLAHNQAPEKHMYDKFDNYN